MAAGYPYGRPAAPSPPAVLPARLGQGRAPLPMHGDMAAPLPAAPAHFVPGGMVGAVPAGRTPSQLQHVPSSGSAAGRGSNPRQNGSGPRAPSSRGSSGSPRLQGMYVKGDLVDYHSGSYRSWIPAQVMEVNADTGHVVIDVKPQPIQLQEQHLVLRPRLKPQQTHLEWMRRVLRDGRIHEEAAALFRKHATYDRTSGGNRAICVEFIHGAANDIDELLGACGSIKVLLQEQQKHGASSPLQLDGFASAFWEQLTYVHNSQINIMPRQHDGFRRFENPDKIYRVEGRLGGGTYGQVKLVREIRTNAKRAMKCIAKRSFGSCPGMLDAEIENLCLVDHPHVAKLYEVFEDAENVHLIMDFCSGGDLQAKVHDAAAKAVPLKEAFAMNVLKQVLLAVAHIHARGIVHLDIKSANIMLMPNRRTRPPVGNDVSQSASEIPAVEEEDNPHVMVIDLGVSQVFRPGNFRNNSPMGTPATMAPEVWRGEITPKADVFSCGVTLFEMVSLKLPYMNVPLSSHDAARWWSTRPAANWAIAHASLSTTHLGQKMMTFERHLRPSASECLQFPGFSKPRKGENLSQDPPNNLVRRIELLPERDTLYRSVAMGLARRWPANQWPSAYRWFSSLCSKDTGRLEQNVIAQALCKQGLGSSAARRSAEAMDFDGDGSIGWTDFVAACIDLGANDYDDALLEAFKEADSDDDGLITQRDLGKLLPLEHAEDLARDVFLGLVGRTEPGARLDWTTFRGHFRGRDKAVKKEHAASGWGDGGFPDIIAMMQDAAGKVKSRWFPVPGDPDEEEEQLRKLAAMGFTDREKCLDAIRRHQNKLSGSAVEELCNRGA